MFPSNVTPCTTSTVPALPMLMAPPLGNKQLFTLRAQATGSPQETGEGPGVRLAGLPPMTGVRWESSWLSIPLKKEEPGTVRCRAFSGTRERQKLDRAINEVRDKVGIECRRGARGMDYGVASSLLDLCHSRMRVRACVYIVVCACKCWEMLCGNTVVAVGGSPDLIGGALCRVSDEPRRFDLEY